MLVSQQKLAGVGPSPCCPEASNHARKPVVSALFVWEAWKTEFVAAWPSFVAHCGSAVREQHHALLLSLRMPNPVFSARSDFFLIQNKTLKRAISIQI